jgi:hypothetical protein
MRTGGAVRLLLVSGLATTPVWRLLPGAEGHGAVTVPRPRNSESASFAPWNGSVPAGKIPFDPWCPFPSADAPGRDARNLTGANGQACFWFSNGCAIGCPSCDGSTRGPIPNFDKHTIKPVVNCTDHIDHKPCHKAPICASPRNATICDQALRTVNINASCGGPEDFYYFSPWRAPGSAPVFDSCGAAGGRRVGQGDGRFGSVYRQTPTAKLGDLGSSVLPQLPTETVWYSGACNTVT